VDVFDYEAVKWIMTDHASFSSRIPAPNFSFIFTDPPEHTRLQNLISCAFTPRAIADLERTVRTISKELFDSTIAVGQMEFLADFSAPIAGMMGSAPEDWPRYKRWNDRILGLTFTRSGGDQAQQAMRDFNSVTNEVSAYLVESVSQRRKSPQSDLLARLLEEEVEDDRLTHEEILAFFRLLMFAGQETATNLLNNAVLSFVLPMVDAANRDPKRFPHPNRFDTARDPNPHVAFGHGIHFCLGAALARLEARIALSDLLSRFESFEYAGAEPWQPRKGLIAHGPASLPIRFEVKPTPAPEPLT
jgi:cytochrome P450